MILAALILVLVVTGGIIDAVVPPFCPKCYSENVEKLYERREYRYYVNGYECDECGYQFEK